MAVNNPGSDPVDEDERTLKLNSETVISTNSNWDRWNCVERSYHQHQRVIPMRCHRENGWYPAATFRKNPGGQTIRVFHSSNRWPIHLQKIGHPNFCRRDKSMVSFDRMNERREEGIEEKRRKEVEEKGEKRPPKYSAEKETRSPQQGRAAGGACERKVGKVPNGKASASTQKWAFVPAEPAIPCRPYAVSGRKTYYSKRNPHNSFSFEKWESVGSYSVTQTSDEFGFSESRDCSRDGIEPYFIFNPVGIPFHRPLFGLFSPKNCLVSNQIWENFTKNQQHLELFDRKLKLRDTLYELVEKLYRKCGMYIVGSSLNGFGTRNSDLDICLMVVNRKISHDEAIRYLKPVKEELEGTELLKSGELIKSETPILRLKFNAPYEDILVDLNANSLESIRNTHLLYYYGHCDVRVRPLALAVKEWARRNDINCPRKSTLSSYSLCNMVIHFLQCGTSPPVLPVLHKLYPDKFCEDVDIRYLHIGEPLDPYWPWPAFGLLHPSDMNMDSLGVLFKDFLRYYADYFRDEIENNYPSAVSIRLGEKLARKQMANPDSASLFIEEPFTEFNCAKSAFDPRIFEKMRDTFDRSYKNLQKNWDLTAAFGNPVSGPKLEEYQGFGKCW